MKITVNYDGTRRFFANGFVVQNRAIAIKYDNKEIDYDTYCELSSMGNAISNGFVGNLWIEKGEPVTKRYDVSDYALAMKISDLLKDCPEVEIKKRKRRTKAELELAEQ